MKRFSYLIPFTTLPLLVMAETPLDNTILNQLDAQVQQRQNQQNEALEKQLATKPEVRFNSSTSSLTSLPFNESPCFPIQQIALVDYQIEGIPTPSRFASLLYQAQKQLHLNLPYCLGNEGLALLMKQIQNNFIDKGYVTTRVVAQEQDLRSGKLILTVILGKVGNTIVADSSDVPRFSRLNAWTALTLSRGDLLDIRDIEQSLENLKRVPTAEANIEIVPSEVDGEVGVSDLKISYAQSLPFRFNLGLDDSGSTSTGKWQGSATLSVDNLFSANDLFYGSFTHSIKRHTDEQGKRGSKNYTLYYSVPFGYWQLAVNHTHSEYHQEVFGAFENNYLYAGKSDTDKLTLSYLLYRDNRRKTSLSGSLWSRQSKNYIDQAEIEVQRRRMSGWEGGISHKEYWGDATLNLQAHYKRGTGARGALAAPEELWGEGTSRPKIITASVSFTQPFTLGNQPWQFETNWNGQWNKTPLIAQDRFSIGGRYTVRGFDGELTLSGESGWLWRNELSWNVANRGHSLYFGVDTGRVFDSVRIEQLGKRLTGGVIGLRGSWKGFYYDYFMGKPLHKPQGFRTSKTTTGFSVGYSF